MQLLNLGLASSSTNCRLAAVDVMLKSAMVTTDIQIVERAVNKLANIAATDSDAREFTLAGPHDDCRSI
eukprot:SAG31_NODE_1786_length_7271_cov_6.872492_7_plen_69_part_00